MGWAAFRLTVDAFVRTRGSGFVVAAFHPHPEAAVIHSDYPVPVHVGPVAMRNVYGQEMTVSALGQPA